MIPEIINTDVKKATPAELHEIACNYCEERFARYGELPPTWIISTGKQLAWIETKWESDDEKYVTTKFIAEMLRKLDIQAYTLMVEVWIAVEHAKNGHKIDPSKIVQPSQRPKNERDDALLIITQPKGSKELHTRYLVTQRPPGLGLNYLGPRVDEDIPMASGIMVNLFGKATTQ